METPEPATRSRRAPARATLILGLAAFGSVAGFILAAIVGLSFLGYELPDANGLATFSLIGAGWGWALGAQLGELSSSGARAIGERTRRQLLVSAAAAVAFGAVLALEARSLVRSSGIRLNEVPWLRVVIAADTLLGAITILVSAREHRPSSRGAGRWLGWVAVLGLVLAAVLFGYILFATVGIGLMGPPD